MVEIRFYGQLRRFAEDSRPNVVSSRRLPEGEAGTVGQVLEHLGIPAEDLGHVFLNGRLLQTRATMSLWLGYPDASERVPTGRTAWETPLRSGDRVALFGQDMALLVI